MTNEQAILQLIQMNDSLTNAILVERIRLILSGTEEALKENPEIFNTPITNAAMFQKLVDNANKVWAEDYTPKNEYLLVMGEDEYRSYQEDLTDTSDLKKVIEHFNENDFTDFQFIQVKPLEPAYTLLNELCGKEWIYVDATEYQELIENQLI